MSHTQGQRLNQGSQKSGPGVKTGPPKGPNQSHKGSNQHTKGSSLVVMSKVVLLDELNHLNQFTKKIHSQTTESFRVRWEEPVTVTP